MKPAVPLAELGPRGHCQVPRSPAGCVATRGRKSWVPEDQQPQVKHCRPWASAHPHEGWKTAGPLALCPARPHCSPRRPPSLQLAPRGAGVAGSFRHINQRGSRPRVASLRASWPELHVSATPEKGRPRIPPQASGLLRLRKESSSRGCQDKTRRAPGNPASRRSERGTPS